MAGDENLNQLISLELIIYRSRVFSGQTLYLTQKRSKGTRSIFFIKRLLPGFWNTSHLIHIRLLGSLQFGYAGTIDSGTLM